MHLLADETVPDFQEVRDVVEPIITVRCFASLDIPEEQKRRWVILFVMRLANFLSVTFVESAVTAACDAGDADSVTVLITRLVYAMWKSEGGANKVKMGLEMLANETSKALTEGKDAEPSVRRARTRSPEPQAPPPPPPPAPQQQSSEALFSMERFVESIVAVQQQQQELMRMFANTSATRPNQSTNDSVAMELSHSRRAQQPIVSTRGSRMAETFTDDEVAILDRFPCSYTWRKDDPLASQIVIAIRTMMMTINDVLSRGAPAVVRSLSCQLSGMRRYGTISQTAELQLALSLASVSNDITFAVIIIGEISILGNPDIRPETLDALRLARLCEPTSKDEVAAWHAGKQAVPVAQTLIPTKARPERQAPKAAPKPSGKQQAPRLNLSKGSPSGNY